MKRFIISGIALLMVGCGIYKPYSRPEMKSDNLYGAEYNTEDTTSIADLRWDEIFTDPKLQALIEQGLESNNDMKAAHLRVKEAEAVLKSARLAYLPSFNFAPNGGVSSFDGSKGAWTYTVPLAASWQIDIFGGITNAKRKAKATYEASKEYRQAVRTQLISAIANYYYTLLMLDSQYAVSKQAAESLTKSAETMRAMKRAGMTTEAGVAQMEAAAYSVNASLYDLCLAIREVENSFCSLLGRVPQAIERGTLDGQTLPEELLTGVPLRLLENRPDVKSAEYALMQAYYATASARSALYPSLTLEGIVGWTNSAGSVVVNPGKILLSAAGSLVAPIFNAGAARAQLKIAKAQQQEALLSFQQSLLNAGAEINNALAQVQSSREKQLWRAKQIESLKSAYNSTQLLMKHGSTTYLEVLTAEQNLLEGELSRISDRFDEIQGTINLYVALGGGRDDAAYGDYKTKKQIRQERKAAKKSK